MRTASGATPRQVRRRAPRLALAAACLAVLGLGAAACSGGAAPKTRGPAAQEVLLQPVAAAGPDPFTPSSATAVAPLPSNPQGRGGPADAAAGRTTVLRTISGSVPGLYGGTRQLGSCDVEQQASYLAADEDKARAFAGAAGVAPAELGDFLRDLTPVVLRADTRVTSHGFRSGRATAYQSVLQAGTAVLVDGHGLPRVRCACGNPLLPPAADRGATVHKGAAWPGFQPGQVVVVRPTTQLIESLVIVNVTDNTWIERKTGDDGAQDAAPRTPPSHDPAGPIPSDSPASPSGDPCATASGTTIPPLSATPSTGRGASTPPAPPTRPADCPSETPSDSPAAQDPGQLPPVPPDLTVPPPGTGSRTPALPPNDLPSNDLPTDVPTDLLPGDPLTGQTEIPFGPGDGYEPYDPYGPYGPYGPGDPYGVPQDVPTDPGAYLESA